MEQKHILEGIAKVVRLRRQALGLTAKVVAQNANLSPRYFAQVEKGQANISILRLEALAHALQVELPAFIEQALMRPKSIALLGIRGAGKSTVGQSLARIMGIEFVELDSAIEAKCGLNLTEIFSLHGEDYYRRLELNSLTDILASQTPAVVALSGGVVQNPQAYEKVLTGFTTIWLRAKAEDYMQRVLDQGDHRPMANRDDAMSELRTLVRAREPHYQRAALRVETSGLTSEQVIQAVEQALASHKESEFSI